MKIAYIIFLLFTFIFLHGQQPQWQWANRGGSFTQSGNSNNQCTSAVVVDTAGNSYATGVIYSDLASFTNPWGPPYITTYGQNDIFLAKYDCGGNLVWVDILGSVQNDNPNGLVLDKAGNIYLYLGEGGDSFHIKTADSAYLYILPTGGYQLLVKILPDGSVKTVFQLKNTSAGPVNYNLITIDNKQNIYVVGGTYSLVLGPGITLPDSCTFMAVFDTALNIRRAVLLTTGYYSPSVCYGGCVPQFTDLVITDDYNLILGGYFTDTVTFLGDTFSLTPGASTNAILASMDTNGNKNWILRGNATFADGVFGINKIGANIIAIGGGWKNSTFLMDSMIYSGNASDMLAIKYVTQNGLTISHKNGNNQSPYFPPPAAAVCAGSINGMAFSSQCDGNLIFDTVSINCPGGNGYPSILHFNLVNDSQFVANSYATLAGNGGPNNLNRPQALAEDQRGNWYTGGTFSGAIYTPNDTIQIANGGEETDMFIAKFGLPCGDTNSLIPPLAPSNLVATATGPQAITVTWQNNAQYVQRFRIYRSLDAVTWAVIDSVPANITTYIDVNVQQNVVYWYKASAVNNVGESQFTNSDSAEIIPQAITDMAQNNIQMLIQPNPNKGNFTLTLATDANAAAQLTIYNVDGQQVLAQPVQIVAGNNWYPIQMPDAPAGVYIVQVNGENGGLGRMKFVME